MEDVRRARAVAEDRRATHGRLVRDGTGKLPTDACGLRSSHRKASATCCGGNHASQSEPAAELLQDDVGDAIVRHDCQHMLLARDREVPGQGAALPSSEQPTPVIVAMSTSRRRVLPYRTIPGSSPRSGGRGRRVDVEQRPSGSLSAFKLVIDESDPSPATCIAAPSAASARRAKLRHEPADRSASIHPNRLQDSVDLTRQVILVLAGFKGIYQRLVAVVAVSPQGKRHLRVRCSSL
jgi:hypothetical protein